MKERKIIIISLLYAFGIINNLNAKSGGEIIGKFAEIENHLMTRSHFTDSSLKPFNIYERMKLYKVPSVSFAVIYKGKIVGAKAIGLADIELNTPATDSTEYQAASLSKSVNALGVMKLVENGKLSLYKDIREYLKTWQFEENRYSKGKKITLLQLLSHTAGFSVPGFWGYYPSEKVPNINEILDGKKPANNKRIKPILSPGEKYVYSGGGSMFITAKIIYDNIASDYDSLVQSIMLKPIGMDHSTFKQPKRDSVLPELASGYYPNFKKVKGGHNIYPPPAGLWTTPSDLALFIIAIQKSLKGPNGFLNDTLALRMLTPPKNAKPQGAQESALGFFIEEHNGEKYFGHGGENDGFTCFYIASFSGEFGMVVMTNTNEFKLKDEIANAIIDIYKWKGVPIFNVGPLK